MILALCLLLQDALDPAELYPLKEGTSWTYVSDKSEGRVRIAGKQKVGDAECTVVETTGARGVAREYVTVGKDGLLMHRTERDKAPPEDYAPPVVRLKPGARKGDSWEWKGKAGGQDAVFTFTNEGLEDVTVPAGAFKAWRVKVVTTHAGARITGTNWYAPGVGIVRQENAIEMPDGKKRTSTLELKSHEAVK